MFSSIFDSNSITFTQALATSFVSGGVAGSCAKITVAPFDRIKILLQAQNHHYKHLGIFSALSSVVHKEGTTGLFRGNGAQMVRIFPYAAIQFTSYEYYKHRFRKKYGNKQIVMLIAGSAAGMTAVIFTYPLDVVRARLAFQVSGECRYTGILHTLQSVVAEGGFQGLYRGIVPTIIGMAPYAGISFYSFETLKNFLLDNYPEIFGTPSSTQPGKHNLSMLSKLLCGGLSGAFAQTISYPLDVARRKMQLSTMLPEGTYGKSWYNTLHLVVKHNGIKKGLYRGLTVNYLRVSPMVAVSFTTYEAMKQMLQLDTAR